MIAQTPERDVGPIHMLTREMVRQRPGVQATVQVDHPIAPCLDIQKDVFIVDGGYSRETQLDRRYVRKRLLDVRA